MFAVVITLCSWIAIPIPSGVVMTLQTFAVALCGYYLGAAAGAASLAVYLVIGAIGVPVFSGISGGIGVLAGPTGGFLYGFSAIVLFCGFSNRFRSLWICIALGCAGLVICHICGILHFSAVTGSGILATVLAASVPYIIKDVLSVAAAAWLAEKLKNRMP